MFNQHSSHTIKKCCEVLIVANSRDVPTVVSTDHHSDKIATTTNSLISTKKSTPMKMLNLNCQLLYVTHSYICTYVVSTRNSLGII